LSGWATFARKLTAWLGARFAGALLFLVAVVRGRIATTAAAGYEVIWAASLAGKTLLFSATLCSAFDLSIGAGRLDAHVVDAFQRA
jgi:hypothetical protein